MKLLDILKHAGVIVFSLLLLVVFPLCNYTELFSAKSSADAISSAILALPDQPSGDFVVLINTSIHRETLEDWERFFRDEDDEFAVIFEDIKCMTARGDITGRQLAERYQAQLPENQMTLRTEDPTLLVSKAEAGYIDAAVFSREMADALGLSYADNGASVLMVTHEKEAAGYADIIYRMDKGILTPCS